MVGGVASSHVENGEKAVCVSLCEQRPGRELERSRGVSPAVMGEKIPFFTGFRVVVRSSRTGDAENQHP